MKRGSLVVLCLLLTTLALCCAPAWASQTIVQHVITASGTRPCANSTTCSMTVSAIGAGHLLILVHNLSGTIKQTGMSGGGTWVHAGGDVAGSCDLSGSGSGNISFAYVLSSTAGATTISWNTVNTTFHDTAEFYEISFTGSSEVFDVCGGRDQSSFTTAPAGVTLTLSGSNDVIIQALNGGNNTMSTIGSSYVGDFGGEDSGHNVAFASLTNTASGTAPTWGSGNNTFTLGAIAFKEVSGGATKTCTVTTTGAGPC